MKLLLKLALWAALFMPGLASADEAIKSYVDDHKRVIAEDLLKLLSMPNVATNLDDIYTNAHYIQRLFEERGFTTELLTVDDTTRPVIFGELNVGASSTITIYIHYDGQPVDESRWATPAFEPVLRAGRLDDNAKIIDLETFEGDFLDEFRFYGRSASDDKAPIIALIYALDAMKAAGIQTSVNIKLFLEVWISEAV